MKAYLARIGLTLILAVSPAGTAMGALNIADSDIINLYLFNEQTSGQLDNNPIPFEPAFYDTAPTGTAQDHDQFNDFPSDGPTWATGTDFEVDGVAVGTGTGLVFDASDLDRTRALGWMNVSQGDYADGNDFTIMVRAYLTEALDGTFYGLYCNGGTEQLKLQGSSSGVKANVIGKVRDGVPDEYFWEVNSDLDTGFGIDKDKWYNIFLIYVANTSLTVAADDGESFLFRTSTDVPAGFDSSRDGFSDSDRHWSIGTDWLTGPGWFDGRIESVVVWDRALTEAEADAIDFRNVEIPTDCDEVKALGFKLDGDINGDCHVDSMDLKEIVDDWLVSNDPEDHF